MFNRLDTLRLLVALRHRMESIFSFKIRLHSQISGKSRHFNW